MVVRRCRKGLWALTTIMSFLVLGWADAKAQNKRFKSTCETIPSEIHITKGEA